jgi:ADP-ribose pyrophosphatase
VTVVGRAHLGPVDVLPPVVGADDATRADRLVADTYDRLATELAGTYGGTVFAAHVDILRAALGGGR